MRAIRRAAAADRRLRRYTRRIRPLTRIEIQELASRERYYRPRVQYLSVAGAAAADLIERQRLRTALELGPHLRPLMVGADVMVLEPNAAMRSEGRVIVHDAREIPWPIGDGAYDLFVGLQVFEHLGTNQADAFREVCRIARTAIVSLPIDWVMADPSDCHHAISEETVLGWFAPRSPTLILEGNPGPRRRVVYVFADTSAAPGPGPTPRAT